jgi:dTDP-4-amino-4,6-dideoxy-D-galactose acyltransferase
MIAANLDPCEMLEWDTTFFGFRIARVRGDVLTQERVQQIDTWCRQAGVRCLYFLSRADDANTTRLAEDNGFRLVDFRMTFGYRAPGAIRGNKTQASYTAAVRRARPEDAHSLQGIARESYSDTRFYFDTNFPRHLCDLLYETWIERSCEGYADAVLVAELAGVPIGHISCHLDEVSRAGSIGLVGVSSQARGRGVGQTLVFSALEWFLTQGAREVLVVTQGRNCAAQRLYQRCGFLTRTVKLWYHKWYIPSEATREYE